MMFWNVKYIVTLVFGMVMFECVVLLHECVGLRGGIAALHDFHPLIPVSGTGTGFDPLSSRERGKVVGVGLCRPAAPLD